MTGPAASIKVPYDGMTPQLGDVNFIVEVTLTSFKL